MYSKSHLIGQWNIHQFLGNSLKQQGSYGRSDVVVPYSPLSARVKGPQCAESMHLNPLVPEFFFFVVFRDIA